MENRAIDELNKRIGLIEKDYREEAKEYKEVLETAVTALSEIQQYRKIGTVDECRKAREKQVKKNPKIIKVLKDEAYMECPCCKLTTVLYYGMAPDYCPKCGQALDYSNTEI